MPNSSAFKKMRMHLKRNDQVTGKSVYNKIYHEKKKLQLCYKTSMVQSILLNWIINQAMKTLNTDNLAIVLLMLSY